MLICRKIFDIDNCGGYRVETVQSGNLVTNIFQELHQKVYLNF